MTTPMLLTLLSCAQLLLITILPLASADLVDDTCKKTVYADFCVLALRSNPRSSTADTPKLGLIMVDKFGANAKSALTKIKDLLGKSPDLGMKQVLASCEDSYKYTRSGLVPSSKESLTEGDDKFAVDNMKRAAYFASECEAGFGGKSLLSDSNDSENKAASVASAISRTLLRALMVSEMVY